jgi:hypothetical protein
MVDPIGAGTLITGGRMIWAGIKWMVHSRRAPWSIVPMSATLRPHIAPWYSVRFFCYPQKQFAIDLASVQTIRPKGLLLRRANVDGPGGMDVNSEAVVLKGLQWTIQEKGVTTIRAFERVLFVKLERGETKVDFELEAQFYDNRRTVAPIWVRTNSVTAIHPAQ